MSPAKSPKTARRSSPRIAAMRRVLDGAAVVAVLMYMTN